VQAVFLDTGSLDRGDLDLRGLEEQAQWTWYPATGAGQVAERLQGAEVVVTNKVVLDEAAIASADRLRLILVAATGTDNVDVAAARRHGVAVANARGYATPSVVQHVFALILGLATRLPEYREATRSGQWSESEHFTLLTQPIRELAGGVLGIVGYGELGRAVAAAAPAFGMETRVAGLPGREHGGGGPRVPLPALLEQADVLSLHIPRTPETTGLIGAAELDRLGPEALLINTARGGIVDEPALAEALRSGRLGGAGLDVLDREPPPGDHPLLAPDLPNCIVTPHVAWASRAARQRLVAELAANLNAFQANQARNRVD
jgi:glycerate dehydrogenase